jgi:hypothetical protein
MAVTRRFAGLSLSTADSTRELDLGEFDGINRDVTMRVETTSTDSHRVVVCRTAGANYRTLLRDGAVQHVVDTLHRVRLSRDEAPHWVVDVAEWVAWTESGGVDEIPPVALSQ